jgi:hypothetical protein
MNLSLVLTCVAMQVINQFNPQVYFVYRDQLYRPWTFKRDWLSHDKTHGYLFIEDVRNGTHYYTGFFATYFEPKLSRKHDSFFGETYYFPSIRSNNDNSFVWATPAIGVCDINMALKSAHVFHKQPTSSIIEQLKQHHAKLNQNATFCRGINFPEHIGLNSLQNVAVNYAIIRNKKALVYHSADSFVYYSYTQFEEPRKQSSWIYGGRIPLQVADHFYVYQTSRNALCLLDSNRQFYYIAPIGGGAMVKKVSKLDYPVKIVYSGKTIDIFAANVSYHLDEHGELSSPGKTVWPTPKK